MRQRPTKFNDTPTIEDAWLDEVERFEWHYPDFEIADCAELAYELELFTLQYLEDCYVRRSLGNARPLRPSFI